MEQLQSLRYNILLRQRAMLANFIYLSNFAVFVDEDIVFDAAVNIAMDTINKIDMELQAYWDKATKF